MLSSPSDSALANPMEMKDKDRGSLQNTLAAGKGSLQSYFK